MSPLARGLTIASAVGAGLAAGVFFAFSTFVMRALTRLPATQGLTAMQSINRAAPNPLFMTALFGTGVTCVALAVSAGSRLDERAGMLQFVGAGLYLVVLVVTIAYHVPRNDALALVDPAGADAARAWARYAPAWTAWNHVRTAAAFLAATTLTYSLHVD